MKTKSVKNKQFSLSYSVTDGGDGNLVIHCHNEYEILYFIRGNVRYVIEGSEYILKAGSLLLIPQGVLHGVEECGEGSYQRYVLSIPRYAMGTDGQRIVDTVFKGERYYENTDGYGIDLAFNDIFNAKEQGEYAQTIAVQSLMLRIIHMQNSERGNVSDRPANDTLSDIIAYINDNFRSALTLDGISAMFFISKHHLNKRFKKATGVTVGEYMIYKRVYYARSLILRGTPATEAAVSAGFSDYSAFYKAYVKRMGHSPSEDKNKNQY